MSLVTVEANSVCQWEKENVSVVRVTIGWTSSVFRKSSSSARGVSVVQAKTNVSFQEKINDPSTATTTACNLRVLSRRKREDSANEVGLGAIRICHVEQLWLSKIAGSVIFQHQQHPINRCQRTILRDQKRLP